MDLSTITIADFKTRFYRDFTFQDVNSTQPPSDPDIVQDVDITNAFSSAMIFINQALFSSCVPNIITNAYLLLTAHCLVLNLRAAGDATGLNTPGAFPVTSRTVGSVSEAYQIPDAYKNSPILTQYTTTAYGLQYLSIILPMLVGNFVSVIGGANAAR